MMISMSYKLVALTKSTEANSTYKVHSLNLK